MSNIENSAGAKRLRLRMLHDPPMNSLFQDWCYIFEEVEFVISHETLKPHLTTTDGFNDLISKST